MAVHTEARGSWSGVIWRPGVIVTAEHALRRDEDIQVTLPGDRTAQAKLAGRDPSTDLAVLRCAEATDAIAHGGVDALKTGSLALVVGRTRASGPVATLGFVSLAAEQRKLWGGGSVKPYVRLDVALQRTAVGGAVVDGAGAAMGLATPRFSPGGAVVLPVALVDRVVDALLSKGHIPRGYLGVGLQPVRLPEALRESLQRKERSAAMILEVEPGGPADQAGVLIGDILIALDDRPVARLEDVQAQLHGEQIGATLKAKFLRGGQVREVGIVVQEKKAR